MITPSPTTKISPTLARGILAEIVGPTATKLGFLKITIPNTNYELHLYPVNPPKAQVGKRIIGEIRLRARRIDVVETGGQYIEPVYGRPRRVQGTVIAVTNDAIVVDAGAPVHVTPTDPRQKPTDFQVDQFVSFDAMDGAVFEEKA
jgi:hypothetical protein